MSRQNQPYALPYALDVTMQNLLLLKLLFGYFWQACHRLLGGLAQGQFGAHRNSMAVGGWSLGLGDRRVILSIQIPVAHMRALRWLASLARFIQGIHLSMVGYTMVGYTMVGYTIAGYQLDGESPEDPKQFSGRYRLEMAVPI